MMTRWTIGFWVCVLGLVAGCGGGTTPGNDTGTGRVDTGVGALDTGVAIDAALPPNDTNTPAADTGIDAAASASDAGNDGNVFFPDGAIMCLAGVECTNWAAAIGAASRGPWSI